MRPSVRAAFANPAKAGRRPSAYTVSVDVADSDEAVDEALLRRLREAICPERAANLDTDGRLEAILGMLHDHPTQASAGKHEPALKAYRYF